jgi:hypothetical protein
VHKHRKKYTTVSEKLMVKPMDCVKKHLDPSYLKQFDTSKFEVEIEELDTIHCTNDGEDLDVHLI